MKMKFTREFVKEFVGRNNPQSRQESLLLDLRTARKCLLSYLQKLVSLFFECFPELFHLFFQTICFHFQKKKKFQERRNGF